MEHQEATFDAEGESEDAGRRNNSIMDDEDELSAKIKKLIAEGKPHDQAVAIAHSMLGLSKDSLEEKPLEPYIPAPRTMSIRAHRDPNTGELVATVEEGVGGKVGKYDVEKHHVQHPGSKGGHIVGYDSKGEPIYGKKHTAKTSMKEFSHQQATQHAQENPHEPPPLPLPHPPQGIKLNTIKHQLWAHVKSGDGVSMKEIQKAEWNTAGLSQYNAANDLVKKDILYSKGGKYFVAGEGGDAPGNKPKWILGSELADMSFDQIIKAYSTAVKEIAPHYPGVNFTLWVDNVYTPAAAEVAAKEGQGFAGTPETDVTAVAAFPGFVGAQGKGLELITTASDLQLAANIALANLLKEHTTKNAQLAAIEETLDTFENQGAQEPLAAWVNALVESSGFTSQGHLKASAGSAVGKLNNMGFAVEGTGKQPEVSGIFSEDLKVVLPTTSHLKAADDQFLSVVDQWLQSSDSSTDFFENLNKFTDSLESPAALAAWVQALSKGDQKGHGSTGMAAKAMEIAEQKLAGIGHITVTPIVGEGEAAPPKVAPQPNLKELVPDSTAQSHANNRLTNIIAGATGPVTASTKVANRTKAMTDPIKLAAWYMTLREHTKTGFLHGKVEAPEAAMSEVLGKLQGMGFTVPSAGTVGNITGLTSPPMHDPPVGKPHEPIKIMGTAGAILGESTGPKAGSNPGGQWKGTDGVERYVKEYTNPVQSYSEAVTNNIYRALGVNAPNSQVFAAEGGGLHFASDILPNKGTFQNKAPTEIQAKEFMDGFGADMWLANWDAVGLDSDNVVHMPGGSVARIDQGGSLLFRAQGGDKPASATGLGEAVQITEWENFFSKNPAYKKVAAKAGINSAEDALPQVEAMLERIGKLAQQTNDFEDLVPAVAGSNPEEKDKLNTARVQIIEMLQLRHTALVQKVHDAKSAKVNAAAAVEAAKPKVIPKPTGKASKSGGAKVAKTVQVEFYDHGDWIATKPEVFDNAQMQPVLEARKPPKMLPEAENLKLQESQSFGNTIKKGKQIINSWKSSSGSLNSAFYKGDVEQMFKSAPLFEAIKNAPKWTGPMFRGMGLGTADYKKLMQGVVEDGTVIMNAPQGFSRNLGTAISFGQSPKPQLVIFHVDKGKTGRMVEDVGGSFKAEQEIIAMIGTQYKVKDYEEESVSGQMRTHIYMTEK